MRILEPEVMMSKEEVAAYDLLVRKFFKLLHAGFIESVINLGPERGTFLDVGTGTGWIAIGVAKYNPDVEVVGVDLSDTMLKVASQNAIKEGVDKRVRFVKGDAKRLLFEDHSFDAVFCHNMLHHIPEPLHLVREMARVVKQDGALLIRDLKRQSRFITELHVNLFGLPYNTLMKKEYRDSILAALSEEEWLEMFQALNMPGARLTKHFWTHVSIERPSERKREKYIELPTPSYLKLFKSCYVSK